ncbi:nucleotide exchange factor GrpE [Marivirga sp. S37H4]|uniref:Protein GrpE n=1 Tax=Marivirga aurantiaca TaxID=2802615 RepID=A0A934WZ40_9BACT|nr:nucleotide exchange factor GrpE [Marivirga aurantiaca]MBK6265441.1 nucleotide exchange factor GrpE [Marivirga aurantiaca]
MAKEEIDEKENELKSQEEQIEQEEKVAQEQNSADLNEEKESEENEENPVAEEELSAEEKLQIEVAEAKDKYIRLYSEFDNFRRRNAKERLELVKTASADLITELLPVIDDFERAEKAFHDNADVEALKEGFSLIKNKFEKTLANKGLTAMDSKPGIEFDSEIHEAITKIPVEDKKLKGKVVDVVEKGYLLNDKVVRYAKVIIGE